MSTAATSQRQDKSNGAPRRSGLFGSLDLLSASSPPSPSSSLPLSLSSLSLLSSFTSIPFYPSFDMLSALSAAFVLSVSGLASAQVIATGYVQISGRSRSLAAWVPPTRRLFLLGNLVFFLLSLGPPPCLLSPITLLLRSWPCRD